MSEIEVFRDESPTDSSDPPAAVQSTSDPQDNSTEPVAAIRGRQPSRTTAANASKRRSPPSPSPPRQQPPSPASSHAPSAENWTVAEIRQVLTSAGVIIPRRSSKSDLLALYNSLQSGEFLNSSPPLESATTASKSRKSPYSRPGPIFTPSRTGHRTAAAGPRPAWAAPRIPQPSAPTFLELPPSASSQLSPAKCQPSPPQAASPEQARLRQRHTATRSLGPTNPSPTHGPQLRHSRPALLHQRKPRRPFTPPFTPPPLSPSTKLFQAQTYPNHRPKHQPFPPPLFHAVSSVPGAPFSLSTTSPLPIPPNALALEPPPVANSTRSIRSQILSEIQNIGTGGGSTPHPSTSLFRTNIPLNHPLKPLLEASLNSILQAVSPRTLQSYLTAWKSFKLFTPLITCHSPPLTTGHHLIHLPPQHKQKLQTSSIKGYLSGLQFFPQTFIRFPFRPYSQFTDLLTH